MKSLDDSLEKDYGNIVPFFPISDTRSDEWPWKDKPYVIYDQMFKMRSRAGYFIHRTQALYFIKGTPTEALTWSNVMALIIDRQDSAAQDLNNWLSQNHPDAGVYFHWFKAMQVDQTAENRMDMALNQRYLSTMVVEFEYHITKQTKFD
jgi:Cdc6-like AAA superfamily ATPase